MVGSIQQMDGLVQRGIWFREFLAKTREKRRRTGRSFGGDVTADRSFRRKAAWGVDRASVGATITGSARSAKKIAELGWVSATVPPGRRQVLRRGREATTQKRRRGRARARLEENVDPGAGPVNALPRLKGDWLRALGGRMRRRAFADTECSLERRCACAAAGSGVFERMRQR